MRLLVRNIYDSPICSIIEVDSLKVDNSSEETILSFDMNNEHFIYKYCGETKKMTFSELLNTSSLDLTTNWVRLPNPEVFDETNLLNEIKDIRNCAPMSYWQNKLFGDDLIALNLLDCNSSLILEIKDIKSLELFRMRLELLVNKRADLLQTLRDLHEELSEISDKPVIKPWIPFYYTETVQSILDGNFTFVDDLNFGVIEDSIRYTRALLKNCEGE